jgi:purine-binding chemotaxis protein CheW
MASGVALKTSRVALGSSAAAAAATSAEDASHAAFWLLCRVGSHRFALPMSHVIENMRMLPIESVAGAPPLVRGLCIIRGAPVPVVDATLLFENQSGRCERLVTVRTGNRTIAFAAEEVLGVQAIPAQALEQLPPLFRNVESIAAIAALDEELVFFLHTARVISDDFLVSSGSDGAPA